MHVLIKCTAGNVQHMYMFIITVWYYLISGSIISSYSVVVGIYQMNLSCMLHGVGCVPVICMLSHDVFAILPTHQVTTYNTYRHTDRHTHTHPTYTHIHTHTYTQTCTHMRSQTHSLDRQVVDSAYQSL